VVPIQNDDAAAVSLTLRRTLWVVLPPGEWHRKQGVGFKRPTQVLPQCQVRLQAPQVQGLWSAALEVPSSTTFVIMSSFGLARPVFIADSVRVCRDASAQLAALAECSRRQQLQGQAWH
jgi:hypothetical protein